MNTFVLPMSIELPVAVRRSRPSPDVFRRRRLAVVGLLLVVAAVAFLALDVLRGALDAGPGDGVGGLDVAPIAEVSVVVEPGDTVWTIADALAPGADPRPVVDAIVAANDDSAALVAGQRLLLTVASP